jgi:hypothetical protein
VLLDPVNRQVHRIRSATSVEVFSDNELDHERDMMETNKLVHGMNGLPSPVTVKGPGAVPEWGYTLDVGSDSGAGPAEQIFSGDASPASSASGSAAGSVSRLPVSPGAVVARRRMSQGCRPVSENSNRPASPLHRCSSTKAERAGKIGSRSSSHKSLPRLTGGKTGSSLRNNSPTRNSNFVATAARIMLEGEHCLTHVHRSSASPSFLHDDVSMSPPAYSGYNT